MKSRMLSLPRHCAGPLLRHWRWRADTQAAQAKRLKVGITLHPYYSFVANIIGDRADHRRSSTPRPIRTATRRSPPTWCG